MPPAARFGDNTTHMGLPLAPGPGSLTTKIGMQPAWRAVPIAAAAGLMAAKQTSDIAIQAAEATTSAAVGPAYGPALAAETAAKVSAVASLGASFMASGADIHACTMPALPSPTLHGPGVVLQASTSVFVDYLPLCRLGDKVVEPLGPPNAIVKGEMTVIVG